MGSGSMIAAHRNRGRARSARRPTARCRERQGGAEGHTPARWQPAIQPRGHGPSGSAHRLRDDGGGVAGNAGFQEGGGIPTRATRPEPWNPGERGKGRVITGETGGSAGSGVGREGSLAAEGLAVDETCHVIGRRPERRDAGPLGFSVRWGTGTRTPPRGIGLHRAEREGTRPFCATGQELSSKLGSAH